MQKLLQKISRPTESYQLTGKMMMQQGLSGSTRPEALDYPGLPPLGNCQQHSRALSYWLFSFSISLA